MAYHDSEKGKSKYDWVFIFAVVVTLFFAWLLLK